MAEPVTRSRKLRCAERELAFRRRAYPRFVRQGRMTQEEADEEIRVMAAIAEDYREADLFASPPV
jgi:hypothetical protein